MAEGPKGPRVQLLERLECRKVSDKKAWQTVQREDGTGALEAKEQPDWWATWADHFGPVMNDP